MRLRLRRRAVLDVGYCPPEVIARFLKAVGRQRRPVLIVALALSAAYLLGHLWVPSLRDYAFPGLAVAVLALFVLAVVASTRAQPMFFTIRPGVPAFSAPPQPTSVILALAFLCLFTANVSGLVDGWGSEPFLPDRALLLGWAVVLAMSLGTAWPDTSVQLRPDGLWQRGLTGWLVVPWDAAPIMPTLPPRPNADTVRLEYGRPELVRRHGLHVYGRRRLHTRDIDPRFITAATRYYLAHPEHRSAIGTRAEYDCVLPHLRSSLDWSPPPA